MSQHLENIANEVQHYVDRGISDTDISLALSIPINILPFFKYYFPKELESNEDDVRKMYRAEKKTKEIELKYGRKREDVVAYLKVIGEIAPKPERPFPINEMKAKYHAGATLKSLCVEYRTNYHTLKRLLGLAPS